MSVVERVHFDVAAVIIPIGGGCWTAVILDVLDILEEIVGGLSLELACRGDTLEGHGAVST